MEHTLHLLDHIEMDEIASTAAMEPGTTSQNY